LIAFYGITSHGNWNFAHSTADLTDRWEPWTVLPWLAIAATGVLLVRAIRADRAEPVP
jgi:hypothetical protein